MRRDSPCRATHPPASSALAETQQACAQHQRREPGRAAKIGLASQGGKRFNGEPRCGQAESSAAAQASERRERPGVGKVQLNPELSSHRGRMSTQSAVSTPSSRSRFRAGERLGAVQWHSEQRIVERVRGALRIDLNLALGHAGLPAAHRDKNPAGALHRPGARRRISALPELVKPASRMPASESREA